ncbi:hypothetical protein INR49_026159 [Caranx melampygus]|nr:hypothetical protein INR49_026159 [Caranx melampygus]
MLLLRTIFTHLELVRKQSRAHWRSKSTDAAGRVAPGLDELLVPIGPSGRAACWEPNERVHERRIELCGDGAS